MLILGILTIRFSTPINFDDEGTWAGASALLISLTGFFRMGGGDYPEAAHEKTTEPF